MTIHVAIVGGSGYVGGELLRLCLFHPQLEVTQVTSRDHAGTYVHSLHPNLRNVTHLRFVHPDDLSPSHALFLALPHGEAAGLIERFAGMAEVLVDCSADFRLRDAEAFARWYGSPHPAAAWLERFVYGLPERHRSTLAEARFASGVGCNATVVNLALGPLADVDLLERVALEVKVGSSEAGSEVNPGSHHPERSGTVRVYSPSGHRHLAEIRQELGALPVHMTVTAIEMVRGVQLTAHAFLRSDALLRDLRDVWSIYREAYSQEPFIRLVANPRGLYRYPEPKILAGTNYCDIGFALDGDGRRLVVIAALDNLMKGAAGSAVQSMNLMLGLDERAGLSFPGLHPI